jgi:hypothetical protein
MEGIGMTKSAAISRREFIRTAGITAAGAVLASYNVPVGVNHTAVPIQPPTTAIKRTPIPIHSPTTAMGRTPIHIASPTPNVPIVDMRPIIRNLGLAIRQQTDLAPCAVHAFTFLLEYQYMRRVFSDLSEAYLQYMTFQVEQPPMKGGENFWALNIGYQKWGIVPQACASNETQTVLPSVYGADGAKGWRLPQTIFKNWDTSSGATQTQLNTAISYLDHDTPVGIGLLWPTNYQTNPIDGLDVMVVPHAANKWDVVFDGHAVALVGYGKGSDFPGGGYFIFRNSWGTTFGDQGYGYMPFDYALNYANDLCVFEEPLIGAIVG